MLENKWIGMFPNKNKISIRITLVFLLFSLFVFLFSCVSETAPLAVNKVPLPTVEPMSKKSKMPIPKMIEANKGKEQLYIKRENINIKQKDEGSSTGSIWADSASPKSLATEFKPTRPGDVVQVNIPENLQYKPEAGADGAKVDPVSSFKFEVVASEPGGDVYLRGKKSYTDENGQEKSTIVLAKVPRRNINNSQISANDLSEVAVSEDINGVQSDYSSTGWDKMVSKKLTNAQPDLSNKPQQSSADAQKEIETQKKALADRKKALDDTAERLKKDRERLDAKTAQANAQGGNKPSYADGGAGSGNSGGAQP